MRGGAPVAWLLQCRQGRSSAQRSGRISRGCAKKRAGLNVTPSASANVENSQGSPRACCGDWKWGRQRTSTPRSWRRLLPCMGSPIGMSPLGTLRCDSACERTTFSPRQPRLTLCWFPCPMSFFERRCRSVVSTSNWSSSFSCPAPHESGCCDSRAYRKPAHQVANPLPTRLRQGVPPRQEGRVGPGDPNVDPFFTALPRARIPRFELNDVTHARSLIFGRSACVAPRLRFNERARSGSWSRRIALDFTN